MDYSQTQFSGPYNQNPAPTNTLTQNMNPSAPVAPGTPVVPNTPSTSGTVNGATSPIASTTEKKDIGGIIKIVVIVVLAIMSVTFIGLFIWKANAYEEVSFDVEGQIAVAVADAKNEQALKDEEEFLEREKYPYRVFSGPADYGQLTFEYPKTWSLYIAKDASSGGDFEAYFNPIEVSAVSKEAVFSLRASILDKAFDAVAAEYQRYMDKKGSDLKMESVSIAGTAANLYTGTIPNTEHFGYIVIFRIRDKTVVLQTDSVYFAEDFQRLLGTVEFNA